MDTKKIKKGIEWFALIICLLTVILFANWSGAYTEIMTPLFYGLVAVLSAIVWAVMRVERVCSRAF